VNLSYVLENLEISIDQVSEQYGIFGPIINASNWERATNRTQVKSFITICFDSALNRKFSDFIIGIDFVVSRIELYLTHPDSEECNIWVTFLVEYEEFIYYALSFFGEEIESCDNFNSSLTILLWIVRNVSSIKKIKNFA
jgi:hypothetical protein